MSKKPKSILCIDDVFCNVCHSIKIKPVTMPCKHSICLDCFTRTIDNNALVCPMCRKRLGSWVRKATKEKKLIDELFWADIQLQFPVEVEKKLRGEDDGLETKHINQEGPVPIKICQPGEVGKEFQSFAKQEEEALRREKEKEELASMEYVKKLQREEEERVAAEERRKEILELEDLALAKKLQEVQELSMNPTSGETDQKPDTADPKEKIHQIQQSTPKQGPSKLNKSRLSFDANRSSFSQHSPSSNKDKSSTVVGPLDSFVRTKEKNVFTYSSPKERHGQSSTSSLIDKSSEALAHGKTSDFAGPWKDFLKVCYLDTTKESSHSSGSSNEGNHFRPIKPSPLTPTKNTPSKQIVTPQTVKPSSCRSFFNRSSPDSSSPKPTISSALFSSGKCAFAATTANASNKEIPSENFSDDSDETDFEDHTDESEGNHDNVLSTPEPLESEGFLSELKALEDDIVRSYCSLSEESNRNLVCPSKKSNISNLQSVSNQSSRNTLSPASKRKRQEIEDYNLAKKLQEELNKENLRENYELRQRRSMFNSTAGNVNKKQKLEKKSGVGAKQKTIEEAFQLKSS